MTPPPLPVATSTRLEKAALDNGFDQEIGRDDDWLVFASTQARLRIHLSVQSDGAPVAALSQAHVARALTDEGATPLEITPPSGAHAVITVSDVPKLHRLLRRAFQLSRSLPDELLVTFTKKTAALPKSTEAERLVVQRVGQDIFREGLVEYWDGRCAVTGLAIPELLRASHIKPWAACATDDERLDVFNGLLLAPHLDAAFDRGFITVRDDGTIVVSEKLDGAARALLALTELPRIERLTDEHRQYLPWHRAHVYKDH